MPPTLANATCGARATMPLSRFRPTLSRVARIACATMVSFGLSFSRADAQVLPELVRIQAEDVELTAAFYRPRGPGPHPAVIALHGCGGLFDAQMQPTARHADWGAKLAEAGFLVIMPDSFRSRGLGSQCGTLNRTVRPGRERVGDVLATKTWLQARGDVKPTAISLLGWSNGGSTVLAAVRRDRRPADRAPDIARAIAFYPGCRIQAESNSFRSRMPLLILIGEADDWTPPGPCEALAKAAVDRGEQVQIKLYKDAFHDFDHPNRPLRQRDNLAFTASGSGKAMQGTNPEARQDALVRVPAFLAR
ncbi:MAG: dienelactone hydrolase family protein [Bosea sp. (in: a-proteobacteria)]